MLLIMSFVRAGRKVMKIIISRRQSSSHRCRDEIRGEARPSKIVCRPSVWSVNVNNAGSIASSSPDVPLWLLCYTDPAGLAPIFLRPRFYRNATRVCHVLPSLLSLPSIGELDWVTGTNCSSERFDFRVPPRGILISPCSFTTTIVRILRYFNYMFLISNEKKKNLQRKRRERKVSLVDRFVFNSERF